MTGHWISAGIKKTDIVMKSAVLGIQTMDESSKEGLAYSAYYMLDRLSILRKVSAIFSC